MAQFDLAVRGGIVVTAADTVRCDLGVRDGKILTMADEVRSATRTIDATDLILLPGGVDSHCHIDQRSLVSGAHTADDFESATRSAMCGGTTTVIPFAMQTRGQLLRDAICEYQARAEGKAHIDYAFHIIITEPDPNVVGQELPALVQDGYTSFKVYLTYDALKLDDRQVLEVLACARRTGALTMIHAENHDSLQWLTEKLLGAGHIAPRFHAVAHSAIGEGEATHRAVMLSEIVDVPVLIVHLSARESIDAVRAAQARGLRVYAETCPQYLFLTADDLDLNGFEGAKYICSPPPRTREDQECVWRALQNGVIQVVSSDHAPYRFEGSAGKRLHGVNSPFNRVPNGIPGIELRLPLLFSEGVHKNRITLNQFVALTSTNPAKCYGIYPKKGTIAVGSDADLVIWDPNKSAVVTKGMLHDSVDYTPYEGKVLTGYPVTTIVKGQVVWEKGEVVSKPGFGQFLPCGLSNLAKPLGRTVHGFRPTTGEYLKGET